MNEQEWKDKLQALDSLPLPDKHQLLTRVSAAARAPESPRPHRRVRVRALVAACLTLALLLCTLTVLAVAAEQAEYREAVSFFEQHELPTDGYTRREIKLIYRDIVSGTFAEDKTAEMTVTLVGGYDISTDDITPELIRSLWDKKLAEDERREEDARNGFTVEGEITSTGVSFVYRNQSRYIESTIQAQAILECYRDGKLAWNRTYDGVSATHVSHDGNHIALLCQDVYHDKEMQQIILFLNDEGDELWRRSVGDELTIAFCTGDGVTVLTSDTASLSITRYDQDGELTHSVKKSFADIGLVITEQIVDDEGEDATRIVHSNYIPERTLRVGDNYILLLKEQYTKTELLIHVNDECELLGEYRFHTDGETYHFCGIAVLGHTLYLSGYAVEETNVDTYKELSKLKAQLLGGLDLTDEELTARVRAKYTAILLQCDTLTGRTESFYSVEGAVGDRFSLDADGNLVWHVGEIASAMHKISVWSDSTPYISHIKGIGPVWEYTVSPEGILLGDRMTDEVAEFTR